MNRKCVECGKKIDKENGYYKCLHNFMQAKYFQEQDESDNVFCSERCFCNYMMLETVYDD